MTHITDQKFLSKRVISAFVELKDGFFNRLSGVYDVDTLPLFEFLRFLFSRFDDLYFHGCK